MKTLNHWALAACLLYTGVAVGQQKEHRIIALANPRHDSIVIRWAPASQVAWQTGNKYGYFIDRFVVARDGKAVELTNQQPQRLRAAALRPLPEGEMELLAAKDDRVALVKDATWSKDFQLSSPEKNLGDYITQRGEADMRFGFVLLACDLSPVAANAAGLRFVDRTVKKGERYAYKISVAQQPKGAAIEPAVCVTSLQEPIKLSPPREFSVQFGDSLAVLQWLSNIDKGIYTAYMVERSLDGKKFTPVTDLPVIYSGDKADQSFSYFKDSLADNETTYYYRVKGLTPFGESGPYSTIAHGQGAPAYEKPFIDSIAAIDNKKIYLQWHLAALLKNKAQSIVITRAGKAAGPYKDVSPVLDRKTVSWTDEKPIADAYYRLKIKTVDGRTVYSLPQLGQVMDTEPPAMPAGVKGTIDSMGIVRLEWQPNKETDLQGYRIFRTNAAHEEFSEVTRRILKKNRFTDTIKMQTLSEKILYRVVAVDKTFNPSDYSDTCTLVRPDKIAPAAPLFTYGRMQDTVPGILLQWRNSRSDDVVKQALYRVNAKIGSANRERILLDSGNSLHEWLDTAVQAGSTYYYEIIAVDEAGNQSKDRSGDILYETGWRPAIKDVKAMANREKQQIQVEWKYGQQAAIYYVYRSVNDQPWLLFKKLAGTQKTVTDDEIKIGNRYAYKIKAAWKEGKTTMMSKPVTVDY
ncbi:hypothetical protein HB364_25195 [Pseudoflavitalea sp. X16]|uniref:hypothetical protein n=1 Tax=Paraflavitalea devenefica TaxID=2716334 RepID=UPI001420233F|nr:hypothetical protein [Paraflavitalea devenefica]NII28403.1 hypothetical protein [Paraflavitalea devenefica]